MNRLAIDPGIQNTGIAWSVEGVVGFGTLTTPSDDPLSERIREIIFKIESIPVEAWDTVVIEDFVGHLGRSTVFLIGALLGMRNVDDFILIHPKTWVKEFFGKKKDYKKAAMTWCHKHKFRPSTQHEADALCLLEWSKKWIKNQKKEKE